MCSGSFSTPPTVPAYGQPRFPFGSGTQGSPGEGIRAGAGGPGRESLPGLCPRSQCVPGQSRACLSQSGSDKARRRAGDSGQTAATHKTLFSSTTPAQVARRRRQVYQNSVNYTNLYFTYYSILNHRYRTAPRLADDPGVSTENVQLWPLVWARITGICSVRHGHSTRVIIKGQRLTAHLDTNQLVVQKSACRP